MRIPFILLPLFPTMALAQGAAASDLCLGFGERNAHNELDNAASLNVRACNCGRFDAEPITDKPAARAKSALITHAFSIASRGQAGHAP